jgi:hypothetical protein
MSNATTIDMATATAKRYGDEDYDPALNGPYFWEVLAQWKRVNEGLVFVLERFAQGRGWPEEQWNEIYAIVNSFRHAFEDFEYLLEWIEPEMLAKDVQILAAIPAAQKMALYRKIIFGLQEQWGYLHGALGEASMEEDTPHAVGEAHDVLFGVADSMREIFSQFSQEEKQEKRQEPGEYPGF